MWVRRRLRRRPVCQCANPCCARTCTGDDGAKTASANRILCTRAHARCCTRTHIEPCTYIPPPSDCAIARTALLMYAAAINIIITYAPRKTGRRAIITIKYLYRGNSGSHVRSRLTQRCCCCHQVFLFIRRTAANCIDAAVRVSRRANARRRRRTACDRFRLFFFPKSPLNTIL